MFVSGSQITAAASNGESDLELGAAFTTGTAVATLDTLMRCVDELCMKRETCVLPAVGQRVCNLGVLQ